MNAHDAIVQAFLDALQQSPPLAGGNVFEEELKPLGEGTSEAIVVYFEDSTPLTPATTCNPTDWVSRIVVECHARRDERDATDGRASRRLHAEAYVRLMADPTLGGLVFDVGAPFISTDQAQLNTQLGCCKGRYPVQHRTPFGSLSA